MKFKVYVDYTKEELPRPFYVGKGNSSRVSNLKRNKLHTNISNKHGIERHIVLDTDDEELALRHECELIAEYKTCIYDEGSWGANFTRGGEGTSGMKHSEETKRKNSESNKLSTTGEKNGMYGKHHSEETRKKIGEKSKGRKDSESTRLKKSKASMGKSKGRVLSEETKRKIAEARRGKTPWNKGTKGLQVSHMKGKKHSDEVRQKISESRKGKVPWNKGKKKESDVIPEVTDLSTLTS
jgi:hypothetical protein